MIENINYDFFRKTNYINTDITYLKNITITEWDIKSAGLSVIKFRQCLPQELITKLENMPKDKRTVYEGNLQRKHPALAEMIVNTLGDVRVQFAVENGLKPSDIISIKKDALFIISQRIQRDTVFGAFLFRKKNTYTSYLRVNNVEFYYNSAKNQVDTKGINSENSQFIDIIKKILNFSERNNNEDIYKYLKNIRDRYLSRKMDKEVYRELTTGKFRIGNYLVDDISDDMVDDINIEQNYLQYLLPLIQELL